MKMPKPPKPPRKNIVTTNEVVMNLLAAVKIASPVPHIDFVVQPGDRILLRRVVMAGQPDGLVALFSEDGVNFINGENDYVCQRSFDADTPSAQYAPDSSMPLVTASNSEPHCVDILVEPGEGDTVNNVWVMPFVASEAIVHSSSFPLRERNIGRLENYNTRSLKLRVKGQDGGIKSGEYYHYRLPTPV